MTSAKEKVIVAMSGGVDSSVAAAMLLEQAVAPSADGYPFALLERAADGPDAPQVEIDWRPALAAVLEDVLRGVAPSVVAGRFHRTLAQMTASVAEWAGIPRIGLTGGCFQNAVLTQFAIEELRRRHFDVLAHALIPPNDGGLAVGQALVAASRLLAERT